MLIRVHGSVLLLQGATVFDSALFDCDYCIVLGTALLCGMDGCIEGKWCWKDFMTQAE